MERALALQQAADDYFYKPFDPYELVAANVLDAPQHGEPMRLALDWRVMEPVEDAVMIFTHVARDEGFLIAQRDAVPGNGAFPVTGWEPGEVVRDQFALQLPADLPVGQYEIRVGIYNPTSGQRYGLTEAGTNTCEGNTAVIIQQLTVND